MIKKTVIQDGALIEAFICSDDVHHYVQKYFIGQPLTDNQRSWLTNSLEPSVDEVCLGSERGGFRTSTMLGRVLWEATFRNFRSALFMAFNRDEADRCQHIVHEVVKANPRMHHKIRSISGGIIEFNNGSQIVFASPNLRAVRGRTFSLAALDNMSHFENDRELMASLIPCISHGSSILMTSL